MTLESITKEQAIAALEAAIEQSHLVEQMASEPDPAKFAALSKRSEELAAFIEDPTMTAR